MELKRNTIIICPNEKKEELISKFQANLEYGVKYISKSELISSLTFSYDYKAVIYLMNNRGYSFTNAKEILDNISFLKGGTSKLDKLLEIREELIKNNLIRKNEIFKRIFDNKDVYIYGYSNLDKEIISLLNDIGVEYSYIEESNQGYKHDLIIFENIEEEVNYFFSSVCQMISSGININDILLYSYPSEYDLLLRKYARLYNLPINFESNYFLNESPIYKKFILCANESSFEDALESIKNIKDRFNVVSKLISVINDVISSTSLKEEQILLINEISKTIKIKEDNYKNGINIISSSYRGDKHVFLLGFSLGSYPQIKKDTDFLLDKEKELCFRNTSKVENEINNEILSNFLFNNKNLHISFKEKEGKKVYYKSLLVEKMKMNIIKNNVNNVRYNNDLAKLEVASYLDLKNDFGIDSVFVDALDSSSFRYKDFDHNFKYSPIFTNDKNMEISFSLIDDYLHCPFKYFVKRICGAQVFEDNFYSKLGTLLHNVLEDSLKKDVSKEDYQNEINEKFTSSKDLFFVNKLFDQIFEVIEKNKKFESISSFKTSYGEQEIAYRFDNKTILKGKIDKIILNEKEKEIIVIDYKTGSFEFNKDEIEVGLSLQLPIYSLLIKNYYPEYSQTGVYIQTVLSDEEEIDEKYKLKGISIDSEGKLERLEHFLNQKSKYIDKLYFGQKGYKKNSSLVSKEEYDYIVSRSEEIVKESLENIRKGNFAISPLYVNGDDKVCKDCPLLSVCFKKDSNNRYLKIVKNKE